MSVLTERIVLSRSKERDLCSIKKLNCWGSNLSDISIVRKMKFVEVLSLSLNSITSLADFSYCSYLKELYLRQNNIENLNELHHLKHLEHLHSLWLEDNPCTQQHNYRLTVLRILPNLKMLDNISVNPEEVKKAMISGDILENTDLANVPSQSSEKLVDSDSENIINTTNFARNPVEIEWGLPYISSSSSNCNTSQQYVYNKDEETVSKSQESAVIICRNVVPMHQEAFHAKVQTMVDHPMPDSEDMSCVDICNRCSEIDPLELINSAESTIGCMSSPSKNIVKRSLEKCNSSPKVAVCSPAHVQDFNVSSSEGVYSGDGSLPSPLIRSSWKAMNSNLLSAVLCLVKELDYASLEIVKNAILCRMDEID